MFRYKNFIRFFTSMDIFVPSYLRHTYLFQLQTKVASISQGKVQFEDTIFHPQGGGQPKDKGFVQINGVKRQITNASSDRQSGKIWNTVQPFENVNVGDDVKITIDEEVRRKHAKLHSAGHLIDLAVQRLKYQWQTTKGYHFEDGPYVQYKAKVQNPEKIIAQINEELKKILASDIVTVKEHYSYDEAVDKGLIPKQFKTPLIRIIKFGQSSCPCGGTHIETVKDVEAIDIMKLHKKGKCLRAHYKVL